MNIDFSQMTTAEARTAMAVQAARIRARAALLGVIEAAAEAITGRVPLPEKLSWGSKEVAARAVLAGAASAEQEAMIAGEAAQTGEAVKALAGRVIRNADAYRGHVALLTGLRRHTEALIDAAQSEAQVDTALAAATARLSGLRAG